MNNAFELIQLVRSEIREKSSSRNTDYDLLRALNLGFSELAAQSYCYERETRLRCRAGIREYALSNFPGFISRRRARYLDEPLTHVGDLYEAAEGTSTFRTTSSQPWRYHVDKRSLTLLSVPDVTEVTTATVTVTRGDPTVLATGATDFVALGVNEGWLFGVGAAPVKWYIVRTVAAASIELTEEYVEASAVGSASVFSSGALRFWYASTPPLLRWLSGTGAVNAPWITKGTVAVVANSTTVTGTGTTWGLEVVPGMEFGVGANTDAGRPLKWYRVKYVTSATVIVLETPYELESNAAATYILTDACPLDHQEWAKPVVHFAAEIAFRQAGELDKASLQTGMFERGAAKVESRVAEQENQATDSPTAIVMNDGFDVTW